MTTTASSWGPVALHSWSVGPLPLDEIARTAARCGYEALELNWQDVDRCRKAGVRDAEIAARLRDHGLPVAALGVEPGWLFAEGAEARRLWRDFRDMAEIASLIGCPRLMSAIGRPTGATDRARASMARAARLAEESGLGLGIEFNFQHPDLNAPELVRDLVRSAESPGCGLVLDTYHLHRAGRGGASFSDFDGAEIVLVQVSDVPSEPWRGEGAPVDRLPPGAGEVRWAEFFDLLRAKGYAGPISFEAPNPAHWRDPPEKVAGEGLAALRRLLAG